MQFEHYLFLRFEVTYQGCFSPVSYNPQMFLDSCIEKMWFSWHRKEPDVDFCIYKNPIIFIILPKHWRGPVSQTNAVAPPTFMWDSSTILTSTLIALLLSWSKSHSFKNMWFYSSGIKGTLEKLNWFEAVTKIFEWLCGLTDPLLLQFHTLQRQVPMVVLIENRRW